MSAPNWITPAGLVGVYPAQIVMSLQLEATPVLPATNVTYAVISGSLPNGLSLRSDGLISGIPGIVSSDTTTTFVIRATDNLKNIKDRTFSIRISGEALPTFTTPEGSLAQTYDSEWIEIPIEYNNPIPENPIYIRVLQGALPPGLEINEYGLIRGYPEPPITIVNLPELTTVATSTDSTNNYVTVLGTNGFVINRPIVFSSPSIGGLTASQVYYVKSIVNATQITISTIPGGDTTTVQTETGFTTVTLPATSVGQATKRQYSFTLELSSPLGNDSAFYSITVVNQNLPLNQGGPGFGTNTRYPTIYNTRPPIYNIQDTPDFGYYVLPPVGSVSVPGMTYAPSEEAYIGQFLSDNYFAFKVLGHDFDNQGLTYEFQSVPSWMTGDPATGWIYGHPTVPLNDIQEYNFGVKAYKITDSNVYSTPVVNFSLRIANSITGDVIWISDSDLGSIDNATVSNKKVEALSDISLIYEKISGDLPPNLTLKSNGELDGVVSYQPTDNFQEKNATSVYTFTVRAYSEDVPLVTSTKEFTLTVNQTYDIPTDNIYIRCTPSLVDRDILATLLFNETLIPTNYLYRPNDINYGKAKSVVYAHAYGIYSSDFEEYTNAIKKNHYWKNITLGELKTAVAKDEKGNVLYEVVYSTIIDNLQKYEPAMMGHHEDYDYRYSESVSEEIYWPRFIDLNQGPWYASSNEIYTSYVFNQEAKLITNLRMFDLLTQTGLPILLQQGIPTFYTSLTPGYARLLYPNSLENMRKRVEQELGADYNFKLLPLWMTSQQSDGNTLGFTPAWVIAYTKLPEPFTLTATETFADDNSIAVSTTDGILLGGKIVFSINVFGGLQPNKEYYVISVDHITSKIKVSTTQNGNSIKLNAGSGSVSAVYDAISYARVIKENIENDWDYTLNQINFQIDRLTIGKTLTYNFDGKLDPKAWTRYPSGIPVPDPTDSQDFYVLFPQRTILPTKTQYNL